VLLMRSNMLEIARGVHHHARMKVCLSGGIMLRHRPPATTLLPLVTALHSASDNPSAAICGRKRGSVGRASAGSSSTRFANSDYAGAGAFLVNRVRVVLMNFMADLMYGLLDPRVTHGEH